MTRSDIIKAIGDGGRTFQIAKRSGVSTSVARYHLRSLERSGRVKRDERLSSENDIYWRPVPPTPPWFKPLMETFERVGLTRDRDASEAENAKRLSGGAVAARPEGHRPEHTTTEQGKRNATR